MTIGRPPNVKPKSAYEYRRYIVLIQILAMDKSEGLKLTDFQGMAKLWRLSPDGSFADLLSRLARYAIESHESEDSV